MATASDIAAAHYLAQRRQSRLLLVEARRLWRGLDRSSPRRFRQSWVDAHARLLILLAAAQLAAARPADGYVTAVLEAQGLDPAPVGTVAAAALSGVASDGRPLDTLLDSAPVAVARALSAGAPPARAYATGYATLSMILSTQVADAGRVADGVAIASRRSVTGYVRMLNPSASKTGPCSRCIILAGKRFKWSTGFERHPDCKCTHIPASEDVADDLRTDPKAYFDSLSRAEQDRIFTKDGAQAIRDGADMRRVVNARRGMQTAGGRRITTALAGRHGIPAVRLMPDQIFRDATTRDDALRLLRLHGYLI